MAAEPLDPLACSSLRSGLNEAERLALLARLRLLTTAAGDAALDGITQLAARALEAPLALVSLVTDTEQFFAAMEGTLPAPWQCARATPLSHSFCQHVAHTGKPLVIPDAREHPLVRENPAIRDLQVIAYLGMPLQTASGFTLGSFCVIDHRPRPWSERDVETLRGLSALVMVEIESRLARLILQDKLVALKSHEQSRDDQTRLLVHDLRTPLNSLLLGLSTVPLLGDLNPDQRAALDAAVRGGQTLVSLVDDLLDTAAADEQGAASLRVTRGLDPAALLAPAVAQVMTLATHRGVVLSVEAADGINTVDADSGKVVRALVNLLSNALKFTPKGGQVVLSLRTAERGGAAHSCFAVRDTGRGISGPDQARLFRRFSPMQEDPPETGGGQQRSSGLGLFFVKSVADAHGGTVEVQSEVGRGSVFTLAVPCRQPA